MLLLMLFLLLLAFLLMVFEMVLASHVLSNFLAIGSDGLSIVRVVLSIVLDGVSATLLVCSLHIVDVVVLAVLSLYVLLLLLFLCMLVMVFIG